MNSIGYTSNFGVICLTLFSGVSTIATQFVLPLFMLRAAISNFYGASPVDIGKLFKSVVVYFLLISSFSYLIDIVISLPEYVNEMIQKDTYVFKSNNSSHFLNNTPFIFRQFIEGVNAIVFNMAQAIFQLFLLIMSGLAPIVFLLGTVLGIGLGIKLFFGLIVLSGMWPIIWYGLDLLFFKVADGQDSVFIMSFDLLVSILKIFAPFGLSFMAINSSPASFVSSIASKGAGLAIKPVSNFAMNTLSSGSKIFNQSSGIAKTNASVSKAFENSAAFGNKRHRLKQQRHTSSGSNMHQGKGFDSKSNRLNGNIYNEQYSSSDSNKIRNSSA
ncbi:MAG: hypothetical protein KDD37_09620, partial [Bdellovibrionales bacterium]|nr:hypothetical protein [Bdellovibrionales bacterium]